MKEQLPLDDFEREARIKASAFTMIPGDGVFEKISAEINPVISNKKRAPLYLKRLTVAAAAILFLTAGAYYIITGGSRQDGQSISVTVPSQKPAEATATPSESPFTSIPENKNSSGDEIAAVQEGFQNNRQLTERQGGRATLPSVSGKSEWKSNSKAGSTGGSESKEHSGQAAESGNSTNIPAESYVNDPEVKSIETIAITSEEVTPDSNTAASPLDKSAAASPGLKARGTRSRLVLEGFYNPGKFYTEVDNQGRFQSTQGSSSGGAEKFTGFNAGMKLEYRFHQNIGISSGIGFNKRVEETRTTQQFQQRSGVVPMSGSQDSFATYVSRYTIHQFEIPLLLNFHLGGRRLSLNIISGISYARPVAVRHYYTEPAIVFSASTANTTKADTEDLKTNNISPGSSQYAPHLFTFMAGADVACRFAKRFELFAGPAFRKSMSNIYKPVALKDKRPSAFGLNTGLRLYL